jgi:hypothetical protein
MNAMVQYKEVVFDSTRWEGFRFREGDIVITTPPKSGTTLTQMLCALLIFDTPDFHAPLDVISPWLDMQTRSKEEVFALLEAQQHRRFIKTHTPMDGLPYDERVTYIVVGRDPRDVAISFQHHLANLNFEGFLAAREQAVGNADLADFPPLEPLPEEPDARLREFIARDGLVSQRRILAHLHGAWAMREQPNVYLFHYADYARDLSASLLELAGVLGIALTPQRAADLAAEASLGKMRDRAVDVVPDTTHDHWLDPRAFFRAGGAGEWREGLSPETLALYEESARNMFDDPAFLAWAHGGRAAEPSM